MGANEKKKRTGRTRSSKKLKIRKFLQIITPLCIGQILRLKLNTCSKKSVATKKVASICSKETKMQTQWSVQYGCSIASLTRRERSNKKTALSDSNFSSPIGKA